VSWLVSLLCVRNSEHCWLLYSWYHPQLTSFPVNPLWSTLISSKRRYMLLHEIGDPILTTCVCTLSSDAYSTWPVSHYVSRVHRSKVVRHGNIHRATVAYFYNAARRTLLVITQHQRYVMVSTNEHILCRDDDSRISAILRQK
jgi:hypothetical protein